MFDVCKKTADNVLVIPFQSLTIRVHISKTLQHQMLSRTTSRRHLFYICVDLL